MMFFQDPSLLQFQKSLEDEIHTSNLKTLFQVSSVPKDTAMREVIDRYESSDLLPLFDDFFRPLQRGKYLEAYRVLGDHYVITIDGSGYFSSEAIGCPSCLRKTTKGHTLFEHWIVQGALVHPDKRQVIPLAPEEVRNTDGTEKQDCETKAAKRLITRTTHIPPPSEGHRRRRFALQQTALHREPSSKRPCTMSWWRKTRTTRCLRSTWRGHEHSRSHPGLETKDARGTPPRLRVGQRGAP